MRVRSLAALAVVFIFVAAGCTRGASSGSSVQLTLSSSAMASLSTSLEVVIINVSGGNIKTPIFFQWDKNNCGSAICVAPGQFVISNVPTGNNVLVQVLAVYEEEDSGKLTFKYADAVKNLTSGDVPVEVSLLAMGSSSLQGHVYGRYLDQTVAGVATGTSGLLEARLKIPARVSTSPSLPPALTVMRSPVFAGWMSLFVLDGEAKFDYYLNGVLILSDLNIQSLQAQASGKMLQVDVPLYDRNEYGTAGILGLRPEPAQKIFLGYFGPVAGPEKACFDQRSDLSVSNAFQAGTSGGSPLLWNGAGAAGSSQWARMEAGGLGFTPGDSSVCDNNSSLFIDHLVFNHQNLGNGHDGVAGFRGPFRQVGMFSDYINAFVSGGTLNLEWNLLPGVAQSNGVTALRLLKRPTTSSDKDLYGSGDGIQCSRLESVGFVRLDADIPVPAGSTAMSVALTGTSSIGGLDVVLCPITNGALADAGVKIHNVYQAPSFKIIGSNSVTSQLDGPGITAGTQMLKSAFKNGFHKIVLEINKQLVYNSYVDSAQVQLNGGAWQPVQHVSATYYSYSTGALATLPIQSGANTQFYDLLNANNNTVTVRVRMALNAAGRGIYGNQNSQLTSEPFVLIGSNDCSSPGSLVAWDLVGNAPFSSSQILAVANSDQKHRFQMRWSGCAGASWAAAPLDYMQLSGAGCLSNADFQRPDALEIQVDPKDSSQADCPLSSTTVTFTAPSNAGTDSIVASSPSHTILHSTTAAGIGVVPAATSLSALGSIGYFYELALIGPVISFAANAFFLNSDGRVTTNSGITGASTSWTPGPLSGWLASQTAANHFLNMTSVSVPSGGPTRLLGVSDGGLNGGFAYGVWTDRNVVHASTVSVDGGSGLMLVDDGAKLSLAYAPSGTGVLSNQNVLVIPLPIPQITNPLFGRVYLFNQSLERVVLVAVQGPLGGYYAFGRLTGSGAALGVDWSPTHFVSGETIVDVKVAGTVAIPRAVIARSLAGSVDVLTANFPVKSSVWSGSALQSLSVTDVSSSYASLVGLADCDNAMYVIGRSLLNYAAYGSIDAFSGNHVSLMSSGMSLVNHKRTACLSFGPSGDSRALVSWNPNSNDAYLAAIEGPSGGCGVSPNTGISFSGSLPSPTTGGFRSVFARNNKAHFVFDQSGKTTVVAVPLTCASGTAGTGTPVVTAQLGAAPDSINGAAVFQGSGGSTGLILFGTHSQYYQLRSR